MSKHLHILTRVPHKKRKDLYKCRDPYCNFRGNAMYLEGRAAICLFCHSEYIVTREALRLRDPHCPNCTEYKTDKKKLETKVIEKVAATINPFILPGDITHE